MWRMAPTNRATAQRTKKKEEVSNQTFQKVVSFRTSLTQWLCNALLSDTAEKLFCLLSVRYVSFLFCFIVFGVGATAIYDK